MTSSDHYDAIVIGTGLGGASLALKLCCAGLKVLIVERGKSLNLPRARPGEPEGRFIADVLGSREAPIECVGGRTKFYGAALYRFRESDFKETPHPEGLSPAWPITYADLEPYYGEAEQLYKVHGASDGDPTEPARGTSWPHPALPHAPLVRRLVARLEGSGTSVASIPKGLDHGAEGACSLCPTCDAYSCTLNAKMDAETAGILPALATGNATLATGTDCLQILLTPDGKKAAGVLLREGGDERRVACSIIVVAGGVPNSARLLRRSKTAAHPYGLGNAGGALGRYLCGHSVGMVFPFVGLGKVPKIHSKTFAINEFYERSPGWNYPTGVIQAAGQFPFWDEASRLVRPIARLIGEHSLMCFYMAEALATPESGFVFDGDDNIAQTITPDPNLATFRHLRKLAVQIFRDAGYHVFARSRPPYFWHEAGSVCMGDDPKTSVVDSNLQVHGIDGLFVADASVLPSAGAVNTGLTIIALALRAGDHIAGRAREPR
jgi:choline dehydrogenase-like flavoprotein